MKTEQFNEHILSAWPEEYRALSARALHVPSLSEARHWLIETEAGIFCLRRRDQASLPLDRIQFEQAVLWHAVCEGIEFVPLPIETSLHQGFVNYNGYYWELMPWIGEIEFGSASFEPWFPAENHQADSMIDDTEVSYEPELNRFELVSAMMALAQFHLAVASFPLPNYPISVSSCAKLSRSQWEYWIQTGFSELFAVLNKLSKLTYFSKRSTLISSGKELLESALSFSGTAMILTSRGVRLGVPVQPVIGNICQRHLRFDEEGLCGLIDFKELQVDSVALDIASLLGSMAQSDAVLWNYGLKAYRSLRELTDEEQFLIHAFDFSRSFLMGLSYLSDIFLMGRSYSEQQLSEIEKRIRSLNIRFFQERKNRRAG